MESPEPYLDTQKLVVQGAKFSPNKTVNRDVFSNAVNSAQRRVVAGQPKYEIKVNLTASTSKRNTPFD
jgi:hypothetical protein